MNSVLHQKNNPFFRLKPHLTQRLTVKRWPKSCSKPSTCQLCMLPSKLSSPSMPLDVPLVSSWTPEMVYPTPSQSMKVTLSPPPLSVKSSVTSRKNSAMLLLTSNKKWQLLLPPPWKNPMNCPMDKLSPLETNVSVPQKPSSNHPSWEWNPAVSMRPPTTPS